MSVQRYISNELHHFTGSGKKEKEQFETLLKILKTARLLARPPYEGPPLIFENGGKKFNSGETIKPDIVCYCDIPVPDLYIHTSKYSHFGLSFKKRFLERFGARPVYYIPIRKRMASHWKHQIQFI